MDAVGVVGPSGSADQERYFDTDVPLPRNAVTAAMQRVGRHTRRLTARALAAITALDRVTVYGPPRAEQRTALVAFNVAGLSPFDVAEKLDARGVEARAGCHCATLAHGALGLDPAASCRLSFAVYNDDADVDRAVGALADVVSRRPAGVGARWPWPRAAP